MTIHKLTAGDGYTYLTRQVVGADVPREKGQSAADYYTAKGNPPGQWIGRGAPLLGLAGRQVTEEQMRALFGQGQHPDAEVMISGYLAAHVRPGMTERQLTRLRQDAIRAATLGRPFPRYAPLERFDVRVRKRLDIITEYTGREPTAAEVKKVHREEARRQRAAVAGYDAVFAPVKSAALLWALDERPAVGQAVRAAHQEAMDAALDLLEQHAAYTRTGTGGIAQIETRGLIAAAFDHYDSRAGDPNLHTHVAISSKVQGVDGKWRSLDARGLYRMTVAASECYNTAFEAALTRRLGVAFTPRADTTGQREPVREVSGVPCGYIRHFSARRARIEARYAELIGGYRREHGHDPPRAICHQLARQANLDTRQQKKPARSLAEMRAGWRDELTRVFGRRAVTRLMAAIPAAGPGGAGEGAVDPRIIAERTVANVSGQRSTWTVWNLRAEAERLARTKCVFSSPAEHQRTVEAIVTETLSPRLCLRVEAPALLDEPASLRRANGESVFDEHAATRYTSQQVLDAEARLLDAARTPMGTGLSTAFSAAALDGFEAATRIRLDAGQRHLVTVFAASTGLLAAGLGPAGSGKTTAMRALATVLSQAGHRLVPLATSAAAADILGRELGVRADNLTKFLHEYGHGPHAATLRRGAAVPRHLRHFALRPGDVVLVDEAGMAGTHDLDQLVAIAAGRGARVRLLGDYRQLSAVESGGALRLIATEAGAAELTTLYRFRDPAEAAATLQLRTGDAAGLDYYFTHHRVRSGSLQAMTEAAYHGWKADMLAGKTTLMAAASGTDVTALAAQARAERVTAGQVEPGGVPLADGNLAGAGDWIITRQNKRTLATNGGRDWVKNGDAWTVTGRGRDGCLQVRHLGHHGQLTLPASYVHDHVQLLYATTAHRAQGATVDTAHPLITPDMTRESLYVVASRARERTMLYTATHELLPLDEDERLDLTTTDPRSYAAREVLETILAREGAELPATEAIRTAQQQAGSLATLVPRYNHAALQLAAHRYQKAALRALGQDGARTLVSDPAWGVVVSALHAAEAHGWQPERLLAAVVPARELRTADSISAVIAWRIQAHIADRPAPPPLDQPSGTDVRRYAALMDAIPALRRSGPDTQVAAAAPELPTSSPPSGRDRRTHPHVSRQILARHAATVATAWGIPESQLVRHRAWPQLAAALVPAARAGHDLSRLLTQARTAAAGDISQCARTTRRLLRARGTGQAAGPLPGVLWYAEAVTAILGPQASERARSEPVWLALEAALRRAEQAGHHPADVLAAAVQPGELDTVGSLSEVLAWRVGRHLASHPGPAGQPEPGDPAVQIARARHILAWTLKAAENNGAAAEDILSQAAHAPDPGTLLRHTQEAAARQQTLATSTPRLPPWIPGQPPPSAANGELGGYLHDAAGLIAARVRDLAMDAAQRRPAWTSGLGDPPADPSKSSDWMRHLGIIAAYRDQYQVSTDDPLQILGPYAEPGHAGHTAYWHAADSVLAARRLSGLEPADTTNPADSRARAQLAADIYLALPAAERAATQAAMISRLGKAWFGARNKEDDHAVTRLAYSPYLAAVLAERGHLTPVLAGPEASGHGSGAAAPGRHRRPLEAAFAHHRTAGRSARPERARRTRKPHRPAPAVAAESNQPQMPAQQQRPAPVHADGPVQQPRM